MPGPPGKLMTREKLISRELHQESSTDGHLAKLFLESEFHCKEINKRKNANSQQNFAVLSAATDSEIIIIHILHGKGQIKNDRIVMVRTGTYL